MGRGYIVEECVEKYLTNISTPSGSCETGLLIGQSSGQRDFVVLAVPTPRREAEGNTEGRRRVTSPEGIDVEWVAEHARQVSRMLPGGVSVLGLFLVCPPETSKEAQNTLKRLVFAVDKSVSKGRLWDLSEDDVTERVTLHICSKTRKAVCKTFDVKDPKCTARPADWKYQGGVSTPWPVVTCSVEVDLHIPVTSENPDKSIKEGLRSWAKQLDDALCLINGRLVSDESELLSGPKKTQKTAQQQTLRAQILVSAEDPDAEQRCTAVIQECGGSVSVRGTVQCRAYTHTNKPKSRNAKQAIKRDAVNTVCSRVEMLLEDLQMNGGALGPGQQDLPRRVFASLSGPGLSVCDYAFEDESGADVAERLKEMLGWDFSDEDVDMSVEAQNSCSVMEEHVARDDAASSDPSCTEASSKHSGPQYAGMAAAAALALLAAAVSVLYLSE